MQFRFQQTLMDEDVAVNTNQTGTTYIVKANGFDTTPNDQQRYAVYFHTTQSGGATSPTTDAKLQTSSDGTNWVDVSTATQLTADGSVDELKVLTSLGLYVRALLTLGGGTKPDATAKIVLACTDPFDLGT